MAALRFPLAFLLVGCALGCGKTQKREPVALYPVTGQVLKNGKAVTAGYLRFLPEKDQAVVIVISEVKSDGTFELKTLREDKKRELGAPQGSYFVFYHPPGTDQKSVEPIKLTKMYKVMPQTNTFTIDIGSRKK